MVSLLVAGGLALGTAGARGAQAVPGGRACVIAEQDKAATVDALLNKCTSQQIMDLFRGAPMGKAPAGKLAIALLPVFQVNGRAIPYDTARSLSRAQNELGKTLTFTAGPGGRPWVYKDYLWGRDVGGALRPGVSRIDHKPAWTADFRADFAGVPISLHEYRQLTPDVWIGRDIGGSDSSRSAGPTGGAVALS